jgi:hypothetical protein
MITVSALFDSRADAERALAALEDTGFERDDISMLTASEENEEGMRSATDGELTGNAAMTGAGLGAVAGGLLTTLGLVAVPGVGPVLATGWLASTIAGAAAGAVAGGAVGGLLGAIAEDGVSEDDAHVYAEGVRRGGTYLSVRAKENQRQQVEAIFSAFNRADPATRRKTYESEGWTGFDDSASSSFSSSNRGSTVGDSADIGSADRNWADRDSADHKIEDRGLADRGPAGRGSYSGGSSSGGSSSGSML